MIEELLATLGAATACSKPVSDLGWRPHGEHGTNRKPVATNLYIAIRFQELYILQESTLQKLK
jgi:electron transfer flavoprotein alpha subunit